MNLLSEHLQIVKRAYSDFYYREYQLVPAAIPDTQTILDVVYTDELFDSEERYQYSMLYRLDLANQLEICEIENDCIHVALQKHCSYEEMLVHLQADYESWISSPTVIELDEISELLDHSLSDEDLSAILMSDQKK